MTANVAEQLAKAERFLGTIPGAAERALARALNKAGAAGRTEATRAVLARYMAQASDVRNMITLIPATPEKLELVIRARSSALSVGYFPHSPTAGGTGGPGKPILTAEIKRGDTKGIGGAFVANLNSGPRVMRRTGGKTASGKSAIESIFTVPLAKMMGVESVRDAVEEHALHALDGLLTPEIDRELKKDGAK